MKKGIWIVFLLISLLFISCDANVEENTNNNSNDIHVFLTQEIKKEISVDYSFLDLTYYYKTEPLFSASVINGIQEDFKVFENSNLCDCGYMTQGKWKFTIKVWDNTNDCMLSEIEIEEYVRYESNSSLEKKFYIVWSTDGEGCVDLNIKIGNVCQQGCKTLYVDCENLSTKTTCSNIFDLTSSDELYCNFTGNINLPSGSYLIKFSYDNGINIVGGGIVSAQVIKNNTTTISGTLDSTLMDNCLCFHAVDDTWFKFIFNSNKPYEYSKDGKLWVSYSSSQQINLNAEEFCYLRRVLDDVDTTFKTSGPGNVGRTNYFNFGSGRIKAKGNVLSLVQKSHTIKDLSCGINFRAMFYNCSSLIEAPELPATVLSYSCYEEMFYGTGIQESPLLLATTVPQAAYRYMFKLCSNLKTINPISAKNCGNDAMYYMFSQCPQIEETPVLSFDILNQSSCECMFANCTGLKKINSIKIFSASSRSCFYMFSGCANIKELSSIDCDSAGPESFERMFNNCSSIEIAPSINVENAGTNSFHEMYFGCSNLKTSGSITINSAGSYCCSNMFSGCSSLTTNPEIVITTMAPYCCKEMFKNCTALFSFSSIPSENLSEGCYEGMFKGCSSITQSPELPAIVLAKGCYKSMFENCSKIIIPSDLPATVLPESCYEQMYKNCSNICSYPKFGIIDNIESNACKNMFRYCKLALTTDSDMTSDTSRTYNINSNALTVGDNAFLFTFPIIESDNFEANTDYYMFVLPDDYPVTMINTPYTYSNDTGYHNVNGLYYSENIYNYLKLYPYVYMKGNHNVRSGNTAKVGFYFNQTCLKYYGTDTGAYASYGVGYSFSLNVYMDNVVMNNPCYILYRIVVGGSSSPVHSSVGSYSNPQVYMSFNK